MINCFNKNQTQLRTFYEEIAEYFELPSQVGKSLGDVEQLADKKPVLCSQMIFEPIYICLGEPVCTVPKWVLK